MIIKLYVHTKGLRRRYIWLQVHVYKWHKKKSHQYDKQHCPDKPTLRTDPLFHGITKLDISMRNTHNYCS